MPDYFLGWCGDFLEALLVAWQPPNDNKNPIKSVPGVTWVTSVFAFGAKMHPGLTSHQQETLIWGANAPKKR